MTIKHNPYSQLLGNALDAVRDIGHPDYLTLPSEPTPAMLVAAGQTTGLTSEQLREAYQAMVEAWAHNLSAAN